MKFANFFSSLQEEPWYHHFLAPVLAELDEEGTLLDIGTGSGKLLQMVSSETNIHCTGIDSSKEMLEEARIKLGDYPAELLQVEPGARLPFEEQSFDFISICSVLFLLPRSAAEFLLKESLRLMRNGGKIIVLTPSGNRRFLSLLRHFLSFKNRGMTVWYTATRARGQQWSESRFLQGFASQHGLHYREEKVLKGFARLEVLQRATGSGAKDNTGAED